MDEVIKQMVDKEEVPDWEAHNPNWWLLVIERLSDQDREMIIEKGKDYWRSEFWEAMMLYKKGSIGVLNIINWK